MWSRSGSGLLICMSEESGKRSHKFGGDDVDEAILRLLEVDGRLTKTAIAQSLGLSRSSIAERLDRLLGSGTIEVVAVPHPLLLGIGWMGYALLDVEGRLQAVAEPLAAHSSIPFCSIVTGEAPLRAEIRVDSTESAAALIAWMRSIPGVRSVSVTQYLEVLRDVVAPTGAIHSRVDEVDRRILTQLQIDGRMSLTEIATAVRRSPAAIRDRLTRLREGGAIRIGAVLRHGAPFGRRAMGVGLQLSGGDSEVVHRVAELPDLLFAARAMGHFDMILTLRAGSALEMHEVVEDLRGWPGVRAADTWIHLEIVKERYYGAEQTVIR
jgi:DNA-binding Lrp family transcriptional regulator